jgi:sterol desaturase/sphingolipid hydroxylase (fatty acid hydroxylase superfamily)
MESSSEVLGPFTEIVRLSWTILADNIPTDLRWDRLLITLFLALALYVLLRGRGAKDAGGREHQSNGLLEFLLPRDIYTHISARVDVWLWVLERCLRPFWAVTLFATVGPATEQFMIASMEGLFGATPVLQSNFGWMLLYSLVLLLCYDFVFFWIHYAMHKVPALWAIHKVHHSAEVLTPLTRYREHVIAGPIWAAGSAFSFGFAAGVFAWLFGGGITQATLFNVGFFSFLFGVTGAFRHYHIQFRYPRWLEYWLQSPAMHHTHHSYLPQHWDTNMAAITSIFDRMFGTLYIPEKDEYTPWGIGPERQDEYRTFWQNVAGPFRDWGKMLDSKISGKQSSNSAKEGS